MDDRHELERRLGEHARTVRGLAMALLRDPAAADDVTQEAVLRACAGPLRQPAALRGWLQSVVERLCGRWRRSDARRLQREAIAARAERVPSAADEVLRAEVLQAIANAVAALPSPLREVVLLRYYDDLPPRAIAARLQLSSEAVESRLRRARAQLAATLRPRFNQRDLRAALLTFAVPSFPLPVLGVLAMASKSPPLFTAALLLLLLGGVFWMWPTVEPAAAPPASGTAAPAVVAAAAEADRVERTPTAEPVPQAVNAEAPGAWLARLSGRVVDERRRPVSGAEVIAQTNAGGRATTKSGQDGRFHLEVPPDSMWLCQGELLARSDERSGVAAFRVQPETDREHDVGVVALEPTGQLRVDVRAGSTPVAGARVMVIRAWVAPPGVRVEGATREDGSVTLNGLGPRRYFLVVTAPDGRWALGSADVALGRQSRASVDVAAGTAVDVQVLAAGTREPIAGAQVEAMFVLQSESGIESKLPLAGLVPLPRTDGQGRARVVGFTRGSRVQIGASHPEWRPLIVWNAAAVAWSVAAPGIEVQLEPPAVVTWTLAAGEVAVPPDGTLFSVCGVPTPLREGTLTFTALPLSSPDTVVAIGPGCIAVLPVPAAGPVPLRRPRSLTVHLHDAGNAPLSGWALRCRTAIHTQEVQVRTDSSGRATATGFHGGKVDVSLEGPGMWERIGSADLERGDGFLDIVRAPARAVRAQVFVGGRPGLPGELNVQCTNGQVTDVREDVDRGVVTFLLWPHDPARDHQVRLHGSWRQSTGVAAIAMGTGPADVELRLEPLGSAVADVRLPADERCQILVERMWPGDRVSNWSYLQPRGRDLPPFTNLHPGRYRLRDQLSGVVGPEVEVVGAGDEARLPLDLSAVVPVQGRVIAEGDLNAVSVRVRDAGGTALRSAQVQADGTFSLRVALDRAGLELVAVRGAAVSPPLPVTGAMADVQLVLPR